MTKNYDFLVKEAQDFIKSRYEKEGHHSVVACALLTTDGKVYKALNVGTYQPSIATCAEIIAIGMALAENKNFQIEAIVAVRDKEGYIASPCGKCREYICDYGANAFVGVPDGESYIFEPIVSLLPNKYVKKN